MSSWKPMMPVCDWFEFIRNELKYSLIRLIIRTGQPGMAPEREVIERYDIDDYKSKTELEF
jgi:hypothetical protein